MKLLHVAASVLNQTPLDWDRNAKNIRGAIDSARQLGVSALCLPELCLTGYGCEDAFLGVNTHQRAWKMLTGLLPETRGMAVSFGLPILHQNGLFNCAALAVDGHLIGLVAKRFLAGDGIHYEPRWFKAWPAGARDEFTAPDGTSIPIGDIHFDVGNVRIGFEICEDAWVANRPGAALALHGIDLIFNPSASHFAFGKLEVRKRFVLEGSRAFGVSYVYANLMGNEAGRAIYDGGALIATGGRLVATGPRFSFTDFKITDAIVDIDATRMSQARTASYKPDLAGTGALRVSAPFAGLRLKRTEILVGIQLRLLGKPAPCSRRRSLPVPRRSLCSITCARAGRMDSWYPSAVGPIQRQSPASFLWPANWPCMNWVKKAFAPSSRTLRTCLPN